jgi:SAM-dependent methyltransferase
MNKLRAAIAAPLEVHQLAANLGAPQLVSVSAVSGEPEPIAASAPAIRAGYRELLIGGRQKVKVLGRKHLRSFQNCTHLPEWNGYTFSFEANTFDEVHAYHQLQRMGSQGDYFSLFATFSELWRVLKPDGVLCLSLPSPFSDWIWGDPGHTRAITMQTITYLQQPEYDKQLLTTAMVDYRDIYKADFEPEFLQDDARELRVILRAVKPSRCSR